MKPLSHPARGLSSAGCGIIPIAATYGEGKAGATCWDEGTAKKENHAGAPPPAKAVDGGLKIPYDGNPGRLSGPNPPACGPEPGKAEFCMDILTLFLIAVGLSMDAFAVSVSNGMVLCRAKARSVIKIAGSFGLFQGLMPLIGYTIARTFADKIAAVDHWIAFLLLAFVGGKMLWEALHGGQEECPHGDPCSWKNLLVMSIATSIDALAVGASFAVMPREGLLAPSYGYLLCCLAIAAVTFVLCCAGVVVGCRFGNLFGKKAEIAGGIVLIAIGIKILLEHTVFA